mmetsp:Transcript_11191/g.19706  ORF Transcript_11191/g.19706 Transcript_11191/m.19706 type:complete len:241 (-) Transcript_11191:135-857(-)
MSSSPPGVRFKPFPRYSTTLRPLETRTLRTASRAICLRTVCSSTASKAAVVDGSCERTLGNLCTVPPVLLLGTDQRVKSLWSSPNAKRSTQICFSQHFLERTPKTGSRSTSDVTANIASSCSVAYTVGVSFRFPGAPGPCVGGCERNRHNFPPQGSKPFTAAWNAVPAILALACFCWLSCACACCCNPGWRVSSIRASRSATSSSPDSFTFTQSLLGGSGQNPSSKSETMSVLCPLSFKE